MDTSTESLSSGAPKVRKSCVNCARIKCRCVPRASGIGCERCHRLSKSCVAASAAKKRGPKPGAASRSARLEQKLDNLVAHLRPQQQPLRLAPRHTNSGAEKEGPELDYGVESMSGSLVSTSPNENDIDDEDNDPDPNPEPLSNVDSDESLARFRREMIIFTPYLYISPDITAAQFKKSSPFLWLNIMAVASQSVKTRNELSLQTRLIIIEKIVAGGERSMDLLLGILTFVNWVHLFPMDKQFASLASQLAVSLVWDLGLHIPVPERPTKFLPDVMEKELRRDRTIEEKRAVLGAFVITSMLSQTLKSADGFRWSPHLDEYLADLSNYSTILQDHVLVRQVKMQLIVNQFRYPAWKIDNRDLPAAWVEVLQLQLDGMIPSTREASSEIRSELCSYHYTTLVMREWIKVKPSTLSQEPNLNRYELYQRCFDAIKAWLELFLAMPLHVYGNLPCSTYSQLCYVIIFLRHITTTRDADWDSAAAQRTLDPLKVVDRLLDTFARVKAAGIVQDPGSEEDQALVLITKKFQGLKATWYDKVELQDDCQPGTQGIETPISTTNSLYRTGFDIFPQMLNGILWQ